MKSLLETIEELYSGNYSAVYEKARCLSAADGKIAVSPFDVSDCSNMTVTRVDMISDRLAYVLTEGNSGKGHLREVIGAIKTQGKWKLMCMLKSIALLCFDNMFSSFDLPLAEQAAIGEMLNRYCHDVYIMDAGDCLKLFWDDCRMYHPNPDDGFSDVPIQVLHERWKGMPDSEALGIKEFTRIYHIELLDSETAIVKLGCAKLNNYFIDYHFLIKEDDQWRMANKMTQGVHTGDLT